MEELDGALGNLPDDRRSFLKKLAIGSAFAVPVISSFTMSNVTAAYAQTAATSSQVGAGGAARTTTTTAAPNTTTSTSTTTTTTTNPNQVPTPTLSDVNRKANFVPVAW